MTTLSSILTGRSRCQNWPTWRCMLGPLAPIDNEALQAGGCVDQLAPAKLYFSENQQKPCEWHCMILRQTGDNCNHRSHTHTHTHTHTNTHTHTHTTRTANKNRGRKAQ